MTFILILTIWVIIVVFKSLYLDKERKRESLAKANASFIRTSKSSSIPTSPRTSGPTSTGKMTGVTEGISHALGEMNIKFNFGMHDHETPVFRFGLQLADMQSDVVVFMRPSYNVITVLVENPVFIPKVKRRSIFEFIGLFNYDFNFAKFEMDNENGSLRLRNILLMTEPDSLSSKNISSWLRNSFKIMDLAFPGFMAIAYGNAIPSEVWSKIKGGVDPSLN